MQKLDKYDLFTPGKQKELDQDIDDNGFSTPMLKDSSES